MNTTFDAILKYLKAKDEEILQLKQENTELWLHVSLVDNLLIHGLPTSYSEVVRGNNESTAESSLVNPDGDSHLETTAVTKTVLLNSVKIWVATLNRRVL